MKKKKISSLLFRLKIPVSCKVLRDCLDCLIFIYPCKDNKMIDISKVNVLTEIFYLLEHNISFAGNRIQFFEDILKDYNEADDRAG